MRVGTRTSHVHVDYIIKGTEKPDICGNAEPEVFIPPAANHSPHIPDVPVTGHTPSVSVTPEAVEPVNVTPIDVPKPVPESPPKTAVPERRYPTRQRRAQDRSDM